MRNAYLRYVVFCLLKMSGWLLQTGLSLSYVHILCDLRFEWPFWWHASHIVSYSYAVYKQEYRAMFNFLLILNTLVGHKCATVFGLWDCMYFVYYIHCTCNNASAELLELFAHGFIPVVQPVHTFKLVFWCCVKGDCCESTGDPYFNFFLVWHSFLNMNKIRKKMNKKKDLRKAKGDL